MIHKLSISHSPHIERPQESWLWDVIGEILCFAVLIALIGGLLGCSDGYGPKERLEAETKACLDVCIRGVAKMDNAYHLVCECIK